MSDILNEPIQIDNPGARPDVIRIAILVDESGSMMGAANDTIKNINGYIDEQATSEKEILVSVYTFNSDSGVRERFVSVAAKAAQHMGLKGSTIDPKLVYAPSGGTPLYDAIATVIMKETSTIPTLVVIVTDGEENSSREYPSLASIQTLIKVQEEAGWSFVFLMAGLSRQQAESYTSGLMGRGYGGATMNYSKGMEDQAFFGLVTSSRTWEDQARVANATGAVMDSMAVSQNFFAGDTREINETTKPNLGVDIQPTVVVPKTKK